MPELIQNAGSRLLAVKETAKRLGVSRRTLEREVSRGKFPPPLKIGAKSLFLIADIEKYVAELIRLRSGAGPIAVPDYLEEDDEE